MKVERGRQWEWEAVLAAAPLARVEFLTASTLALRAVKMVVAVRSTNTANMQEEIPVDKFYCTVVVVAMLFYFVRRAERAATKHLSVLP